MRIIFIKVYFEFFFMLSLLIFFSAWYDENRECSPGNKSSVYVYVKLTTVKQLEGGDQNFLDKFSGLSTKFFSTTVFNVLVSSNSSRRWVVGGVVVVVWE